MDATSYIQTEVVEWLVNGTAMDSPPGNIYVALHDGDPGADASANELAASSYSRYESTVPGDWNIPQTGSFENAIDFVFSEAQEDWGTVTHFSLWDSATGGNSLAEDELLNSSTINTGDAAAFRSGNLSGTFE